MGVCFFTEYTSSRLGHKNETATNLESDSFPLKKQGAPPEVDCYKKTLKNVNICMPRAALKLNTVGTSGEPQDVEMETCML